jgi:hypothetical protein
VGHLLCLPQAHRRPLATPARRRPYLRWPQACRAASRLRGETPREGRRLMSPADRQVRSVTCGTGFDVRVTVVTDRSCATDVGYRLSLIHPTAGSLSTWMSPAEASRLAGALAELGVSL